MKRIWIAAAVLLILATLCAGEQRFISDTADTLAVLANRSAAAKDGSELKKYWSKRKNILLAVSHRETLSEIDEAIDKFEPESDSAAVCREKADEIISLARKYSESQTPSLPNIF